MKGRSNLWVLAVGVLSLTLLLTGCTTIQTRISENPAAFQRLSPADQALVQQGRIRDGMSQDAVYIAWGPPSQRAPGMNRGHPVETWIYFATEAGNYPGPFYYGYGYGYGPGYGSWGGRRGLLYRGNYLYNPFYDPFFYNGVNFVRYPERLVSFQNGRLIAFQLLPPPSIY